MPELRVWLESLATWQLLLYGIGAAFFLQVLLSRLLPALLTRTKTDLDNRVLRAIHWPLFLSLTAIVIAYAIRKELGKEAKAIPTTDAVLVTIVIFFWARALMRIGDAVLEALSRQADRFDWIQPRSLPLFEMLLKLLLIGTAIYWILVAWDIDVTAWLASAGILGIAVGFAAKDTLANLFAGIFILTDAPYKPGDFILTEAGERGRVTDIGLRSTRILTRDDIEITIPNGVMANSKIVNETSGRFVKRRVRLTVGVAYGSDIDRVREVLMQAAATCSYVQKDPEPRVRFREFGDSALTFQLMGWIDEPVLRGRAVDQLNTAVYKAFDEAGIEIPFPQRVVHLQRAESA